MISIYFNSNGYHVKGNGIDAALYCSPSLDDNGELYYPEHCHVYAVLAKALNELRDKEIDGDVMAYNDTRVIDEMNGAVVPLDEISQEFRDRIRHEILPCISANVFFRKKNYQTVANNILVAKHGMIDVPDKREKLQHLKQVHQEAQKNKSIRALNKLKEYRNGKRN